MIEFGFIGSGNMGGALCKGVCKKINPENVAVADKIPEKAMELAKELNCKTDDAVAVARLSKYIFIAVKPQMLTELADEIIDALLRRTDRFILVSMVAGKSIKELESIFGNYPIIRIMPNVGCAIGEGMTLCAENEEVTQQEHERFIYAMEKTGVIDLIPERLIDASSAVSGCGPAYAFMIIEALADGAVACGVPRDKAYLYASQMLKGSCELFMQTGKSPSELKDSVTSPAGTTIEGVRALEKGGLRSALTEAVISAFEKTKAL